MAERRYGFRFSFAEGCVIVASLCGASFLVFMFGIYAGRELEARKAAEHMSSVRLTVSRDGESRNLFADENPSKDGSEKSHPSSGNPEPSKTVVVLNPPKPTDTPIAANPSSSPPASPVSLPSAPKESEAKAAIPQKPAASPEERKPSPPSVPTVAQRVQEKTQLPREAAPGQVNKKLQSTGGRWSVQIHATRDEDAAQQLAKQLRNQGYAPAISKVVRDGEVWYRVRVGSFANADEARTSIGALRKNRKFSQAYPVSN